MPRTIAEWAPRGAAMTCRRNCSDGNRAWDGFGRPSARSRARAHEEATAAGQPVY